MRSGDNFSPSSMEVAEELSPGTNAVVACEPLTNAARTTTNGPKTVRASGGDLLKEGGIVQDAVPGGTRQVLKIQREIYLLKSRGISPSSPSVPRNLQAVYSAYQERLAEYGVS
ncbi:hypothetical protein SY88_02170 [Clostridiales bacterium PH28_bin88]|nr:hypothetical protein SY88_02170 [Clostridiales bacterium PH28_bin88]